MPEEIIEGKEEGVQAPATDVIKIGDKEYTQDDLQHLVELGEIGKEAESKYNTRIDRVWQDYGKTKNELKALQEEYEQVKNAKPETNLDDETSIKEAKEAARKLGIITDEDFGSHLDKVFKQKYQEERAAERLLDTAKGLETKYNGKDGRPTFQTQDMLEYMRDEGINDPEKAYKLKYETELEQWKEKQLQSTKKTGFYSEAGVGATPKEPKTVNINRSNLDALVREQLMG